MDFILIGADPLALEFVDAARAAGHRLIAVWDQGSHRALTDRYTGTAAITSLEQIKSFSNIDYLILAGDYSGRADRLRTILRSDPVDLILSVPVAPKPDVYYELGLWQQESGAKVLGLLPELFHPGLERMKQLLRHGQPDGATVSYDLELLQPLPDPDSSSRFSSGWHWIREFSGEIDEVSTIASSPEAGAASDVVVSARLRNGQIGSIRYSAAVGNLVQLRLRRDADDLRCELPNGFPGEKCLLEGTVAGRPVREAIHCEQPAVRLLRGWEQISQPADGSLTTVVTRQVELAEAVRRSLHYQRAVSLEYDEFSEEASFKGIMATTGCGLLWAVVLVAILAAMGVPFVHYLVLPALILFLLLQTLGLVFRRPNTVVD